MMIKFRLYFVCCLLIGCTLFCGCAQNEQTVSTDAEKTADTPTGSSTPIEKPDQASAVTDSTEKPPPPQVILTIIEVEGGWGYDVFVNGKQYVHQPTIPSVPGLKAFATKEDAQKAAMLVQGKIQRGIMPPSVTPEELDSLGINY